MTPRLDCMRGNGRLDVLTILERALAELSSLLFELLDSTLVDTTALVDQVPSGGRFSGIDVTDELRFQNAMPRADLFAYFHLRRRSADLKPDAMECYARGNKG